MKIDRNIIANYVMGYGVAILIFVTLLEISVGYLLDHSELLRFKPDNLLRNYYMGHDRNIIQYQKDCSRYDQDLSYTLKPGTCRFSNREFDTGYAINSLGMRDDEDSLAAPEVIVLGDSFAMGWGVEQHETFAQIIENKTGLKVLNTAISSYGTAREIKALSRLPLDKAKFLIIQYCDNDYEENLAYLRNNNVLPIMSEAAYEKAIAKHDRKKKYTFGKHTAFLLKSLKKQLAALTKPASSKQRNGFSHEAEAHAFLNVLTHAPVDLAKLHIIVMELDTARANDGLFIGSLNHASLEKTTPPLDRIMTVNLSPKLADEDFFALDDHLNSHGHKIVADALIDLMRKTGSFSGR